MQRPVDREQRNAADAQTAEQHIFHVPRTNQIGKHDSQKGAEHGNRDSLRSFLGREVSHVVSVHKPIANTRSRGASSQPGDVLADVGERRKQEEVARAEWREDFKPC